MDRRKFNRGKSYWTDEMIERELRTVTGALGLFPSALELRQMGRNDLACQVSRRGGFIHWSERLGLARKHSDSDTGWDGERAAQDMLIARGIPCERMPAVKSPYDLIADGVLRIDVKSAKFSEYRTAKAQRICSGWFFRLGKHPQADLILLYKLDTGGFVALPWWVCPTGNITISADGGKYAQYVQNWFVIERMIGLRRSERELFTAAKVVAA